MSPNGFNVVIPARYGSTRLPGKPLLEIAGKPLIRHVYDRAIRSGAAQILIATDDARIADVGAGFGADVALTRSDHRSGTDRIAQVIADRKWRPETIIVNLQGDEPCMEPTLVDQVAGDLEGHDAADVSTLACPVKTREALFDPNLVKVVTDAEGYALYFSRAPIPWPREGFREGAEGLPADSGALRHIGLYAYRAAFLERFVGWSPAPLETAECLEQLRVLWYGGRIHVSQAAKEPGPGVDTPSDVQAVLDCLGFAGP